MVVVPAGQAPRGASRPSVREVEQVRVLVAGAGGVHVPVDLAAGTGTGVSAHERAATVRRLAHADARPEDFLRPGHVFPLAGRPEGLAARRGHTEASLALCQVAGLPTVAANCEVMGPDGHMLTGPAVERFTLKWGVPMISVDELAARC
jgi:3,4-dihydroxy 2-butanone 4-phosphate synthase